MVDVRDPVAETRQRPDDGRGGETADPQTTWLDAVEASVPDDLRGVPGIPRYPEDERFYAREYPLKHFFLNNKTYTKAKKAATRFVRDVWAKDITAITRRALVSHRVKPKGTPVPGEDLTHDVRRKALDLGASLVGFVPYDLRYTVAEYKKWVRFHNVIVVVLEEDWEEMQYHPEERAEIHAWGKHVQWGYAALELADYIRSRGYRVQVESPWRSVHIIQHYAVAAGLGQMGANGQLLSPRFGPRSRLGLLTTEAPLTHDRPRDYGIPQFCEQCQVCVRRCPGRALSAQRIHWRGIYKFKSVTNRCAPMIVKYNQCAVCRKVCPIQKYGYDSVIDHYRTTGQVLGKGTDELEGYALPDKGYFGPGKLPIFSRAEIETPGIKTNRGDFVSGIGGDNAS